MLGFWCCWLCVLLDDMFCVKHMAFEMMWCGFWKFPFVFFFVVSGGFHGRYAPTKPRPKLGLGLANKVSLNL